MWFKLHGVKEIYSDLEKYYDSREELSEFAIIEPSTIEYFSILDHLMKYFGYRGGALLYYLNPAPGSEPSIALVQIDGQEDVDKMVDAHTQRKTKICHLYIVNGAGFYAEDGYAWQSDDEGRPWQSDVDGRIEEVPEQDDMSPVMKKQRVDEYALHPLLIPLNIIL